MVYTLLPRKHAEPNSCISKANTCSVMKGRWIVNVGVKNNIYILCITVFAKYVFHLYGSLGELLFLQVPLMGR